MGFHLTSMDDGWGFRGASILGNDEIWHTFLSMGTFFLSEDSTLPFNGLALSTGTSR